MEVCRCKGKPDVYVVYADGVPFSRLVDALHAHCRAHLDRGESPSVWLDVFALEQPLHLAPGASACTGCDWQASDSAAVFRALAGSEDAAKEVLYVDGNGRASVCRAARS